MLHIENIKFMRNNGPDIPAPLPHASNGARDLLSPGGFFSLLTNQLQADRQFADPFAIRQESPKFDAPVSMNDTERTSREFSTQDRRADETTSAVGRADEHGQKAALGNQARETANADAQKKAVENRPDVENQMKKAGAKETANDRIKTERKEKKQGEPDMRDMIDGLNRMIEFLKGKDQPELRNVKLAAQELHDRLRDTKALGDRTPLKKALEKLSDAIRALEAGGMKGSPAEQVAGALAGMKSQRSRIKEARDDAQHRKAAPTQDLPLNAVKELLARIEAAIEAAGRDGAGQHAGRDGQGSGAIFSFNQFKTETNARHADAPAAQRTNILFRENLESMIQNARVAVKDGQNASFSMRLHPRELGSIHINLDLHDGVVIGKFLVDTQEAKELLTSSLDYIRRQLSESGVQVGEFQVNVNDRRGEFLRDREAEQRYAGVPAEQAAVIEQEYASNAAPYHDGHINVVI